MKINSFKAQNVHDYLDFDIDFYPDLTFLIGINGSGKTSALKLILGLSSPTYQYLNQIDYSFCELVCSTVNNEKDIIIRAEQNKLDNSFTITLKLNNELFAIPSQQIKRIQRNIDSQYDLEEIISIEQRNHCCPTKIMKG